jgi:hypothetical protein
VNPITLLGQGPTVYFLHPCNRTGCELFESIHASSSFFDLPITEKQTLPETVKLVNKKFSTDSTGQKSHRGSPWLRLNPCQVPAQCVPKPMHR